MYRLISIALAAAVVAGPSLAADAACSTAPAAKFQSEATLKEQLTSQGMNVRQIKTEGGCYEVYALDKAGKKVNVAFNAETLAPVANAEAGEN
jgi:hypothetical protein